MILLALALMLYNACRSGRPVPASGEIKKMNNKYKIISLFSLCFSVLANAQNEDTISTKNLKTVIVQGYRFPINEVKQLKEVHQTYITSGRKHEVIVVQDLPTNLAEKTGRQVFAKIPGAFVYDMDGSGNQVNVSTRGLDPHRSW